MNKIVNKKGEVFAVKATSKKDGDFLIPVVDVRRQRERADGMIKNLNHQNGSRYIKKSYSLIGRAYN